MTTGSSGGFLLAFLAAFEVGDRVAMARPGYPCYRNVLTALGIEVVEIPTGPETRFQPTVEQVAALHEAQPITGLVVASPANPTGTMLLPQELAALARWCEEHHVQLVSDEIYHGIEYAPLDGTRRASRMARSAWETSREAVVFASFSKYFSMTGWRIGWMLVPDRLRRAVDVLTGNFTICPPVIAQRACLAAFDPASYAELDGHVRRYAGNRRLLLDGLPKLGHHRPRAGRRRVLRLRRRRAPDRRHDGVRPRPARAHRRGRSRPGVDFDTESGHRFVRFSFAGPEAGHRGGPRPAVHSRLTRRFRAARHRASRVPTSSLGRTDMYGDTEAIRGLARGLRRQADDIRWEADTLLARADAVPWQGRRRRCHALPGALPGRRAEADRRAARRRRARPSTTTRTRSTGSSGSSRRSRTG